jgi:hypothetical protein
MVVGGEAWRNARIEDCCGGRDTMRCGRVAIPKSVAIVLRQWKIAQNELRLRCVHWETF